eukprot:GHRR01022932.1.p1 GENE.GHRR01022932.1~~GHRR01022932.1.p1  ORF type:complete len:194 (+),score=56.18 GHRR01022932.1:814-1395(+)
MKSKSDTRNYVLGLGAAGAVAVMAAAALAYAVSFKRKRPAYSRQEWSEALSEIGTIRNFEGIVDDIADRGIHPDIRADAWPFLLEVFDYNSTFQQRQQQHQLMVRQYQQLLLQCQVCECNMAKQHAISCVSRCVCGRQHAPVQTTDDAVCMSAPRSSLQMLQLLMAQRMCHQESQCLNGLQVNPITVSADSHS